MPTRYNDRRPIAEENYLWAGEQLAAQFGPFTIKPMPIRSAWMHQGLRYEENNLRVLADVEATSENETFFARFKEVLKQRFDQLDIWIVSYEIHIT